jgi:hypothetical protein
VTRGSTGTGATEIVEMRLDVEMWSLIVFPDIPVTCRRHCKHQPFALSAVSVESWPRCGECGLPLVRDYRGERAGVSRAGCEA